MGVPHYRVPLTVVASYANNGRYPVGYDVVKDENNESYSWFINLMKSDLQLQKSERRTIILDENLEIYITLKDTLPKVEYRFYALHILQNFTKNITRVQTFNFMNIFGNMLGQQRRGNLNKELRVC